MFFNSNEETNRSRKEIKKLFDKRSVKYLLKSYYWEKLTFSGLRFSKFKNFVAKWAYWELQLMQISLNFQISCCNLKIRGLGARLWVTFPLFQFWKELWRFKVKESIHFVEQKYNFNKNETESKMENPTHNWKETNLVLQLI